MFFQTLSAMITHIAWVVLARNGWMGNPIECRMPLIRPARENSIDHMIETITHDVTTGRKNAVRSTSRPRSGSFIMKATTSARIVSPMTANTVKNAVFPSAWRNCGSWASLTKLPKPTKTGARLRVASKKLR